MHSDPGVTFLCDQNLGRLARWLRLMGFDAAYMRRWNEEVALEATESGRILLTTSRKKASYHTAMLIDTDDINSQVKQVLRKFDLEHEVRPLTRCIICNEPLVSVTPEEIKGKVPEYVYLTHSSFAECPSCHRVYWEGTHSNNIMKTINMLLEKE